MSTVTAIRTELRRLRARSEAINRRILIELRACPDLAGELIPALCPPLPPKSQIHLPKSQ